MDYSAHHPARPNPARTWVSLALCDRVPGMDASDDKITRWKRRNASKAATLRVVLALMQRMIGPLHSAAEAMWTRSEAHDAALAARYAGR